jgi:hypothetical protein
MRKDLLEQYSEIIQFSLRKSYRLIIDDKNILRNFQEERREGAVKPAFAF